MQIHFDCSSRGSPCVVRGEHTLDQKYYRIAVSSKMVRIVKLCEAQATKHEYYGWNTIEPFQLPEDPSKVCLLCGNHEDDLDDDLCLNNLCETCCAVQCDACVECNHHGTKRASICNSGRCKECCVKNCKACITCSTHHSSVCQKSRCKGCCRDYCVVCRGCHNHRENLCEYCNKCSDCCACVFCINEECDALRTCEDCDFCGDCCDCVVEEEEGVRAVPNENSYGGPWKAKDKEHRIQFDCSRLVGVEWEYNQANTTGLTKWKDKWGGQLISDGSCGYEAVSPPMAGDHMVNCLTELGKAFKDGNAMIDERCGVHVHVDAGDMAWNDMFRVLKIYALTEPVLYMLAGQNRIKNRYCIPCGENFANALTKPDKKGAVLEAAYTERGGRTGHQYIRQGVGKKDSNRYKGLNLCPWLAGRKAKAKDTTVEFRIHKHAPFAETDRVINWVKVCAKIVDWSRQASDKDVDDLPKSGLRALCKVVVPECNDWILTRLQSWRTGTNRVQGLPRRIRLKNGKYVLDMSGQ